MDQRVPDVQASFQAPTDRAPTRAKGNMVELLDDRPGIEDGNPAPAPNVSAFPLDDELVLCAEPTGNVYVLNRTGAQIWALLDGSRTRREVAVAIGETYGIEFQDALADVDELVGDLTSAGLVCRA